MFISTLCIGQTSLKVLDVYYLQDHNMGSGDLRNLTYYVKMCNSDEPYNLLNDKFLMGLPGNVELWNNSKVKFVSSNFRPATPCYIEVDLGGNNVVKFWYFVEHLKPYDTQFTTKINGILLKLYFEDKK